MMKNGHYQKGFFGEISFFGWFVIIAFFLMVGAASADFYGASKASVEQMKEVNHLVAISKNEAFFTKFSEEVKKDLKKGWLSRNEAESIMKKYETMKLQQSVNQGERK